MPQGGYTLDPAGNPIKQPYVPAVGEVIDRYGPPNGRYTSPVQEGVPYSYDQRSLPYVEDPARDRQYEVIGDMQDIRAHYVGSTTAAREAVDDDMTATNKDWNELQTQAGDIASGFGSCGGGAQIELLLPVNLLEKQVFSGK